MNRTGLLLSVVSLALLPAHALAGPPEAHSLPWPLLNGQTGEARDAIGNSFGEFQSYTYVPDYLHTGLDIRGRAGDEVIAVASGFVWMAANLEDCTYAGSAETVFQTGNNCRVYTVQPTCADRSTCSPCRELGDPQCVLGRCASGDACEIDTIYYYSHLNFEESAGVPMAARAVIEAASDISGENPPEPIVRPGTSITAGEVLAAITNFTSGAPALDWPHLHFSVIEPSQNFDLLHPLDYLDAASHGIVDDEDPSFPNGAGSFLSWTGPQGVYFTAEQLEDYPRSKLECSDAPIVEPAGLCHRIWGNLDVVVQAEDSFSTRPVLDDIRGQLGDIGIHSAEYFVRRVSDGEIVKWGTWYRFDRMPLDCPGAEHGAACGTGYQDFLDHSAHRADSALMAGEGVSARAFTCESESIYVSSDLENYHHIVTNEWGENGSWDTGASGEGWYQVSVVVADHAGNSAALSRFVTVDDPANGEAPPTPDVYVRDHWSDVGAVPSNLGNEPWWTSPDIIIVNQGKAVSLDMVPYQPVLVEGDPYDVYVRVHNGSCATVSGVEVHVYSADPSIIAGPWVGITPGFVGNETIGPFETRLVGPFSWIPTAEETGNEGHRCLLTEIRANGDPLTEATSVTDDNNRAQRNIQIGGARFSIRNPYPYAARVGIAFDALSFPVTSTNSSAVLRIAWDPVFQPWLDGVEGATTYLDVARNELVIAFERRYVTLPVLPFGPSEEHAASMNVRMPYWESDGTNGQVSLQALVNGAKYLDGISFEAQLYGFEGPG